MFRRVTFDLVGLLPSPAQIDTLAVDTTPQAYQRLVDRLLASYRYGERWAQHWLDLARFAETVGFELDSSRSQAWRYRDWVIDALNRDLPFDQFIHCQLAGDELFPGDQSARITTSFCLAGPDMPDINSQEERRQSLLNEMMSTVGSVFLAMQMGCAQCHDHKYDPISQADFYRLLAVFEPAVHLKKRVSVGTLKEKKNVVPTSHIMLGGDWRRAGPVVAPAFPRIVNPDNALCDTNDPGITTSGRRVALARWLTQKDHPLTERVISNRLWQFHFGYGLSRTPSNFSVKGDIPSHPELLNWLAAELIRHDWSLKWLH